MTQPTARAQRRACVYTHGTRHALVCALVLLQVSASRRRAGALQANNSSLSAIVAKLDREAERHAGRKPDLSLA